VVTLICIPIIRIHLETGSKDPHSMCCVNGALFNHHDRWDFRDSYDGMTNLKRGRQYPQ